MNVFIVLSLFLYLVLVVADLISSDIASPTGCH